MAGATGDPGRTLGWNALKGLEESAPYCTAVRVVTGFDCLPAYSPQESMYASTSTNSASDAKQKVCATACLDPSSAGWRMRQVHIHTGGLYDCAAPSCSPV